MAGFEPAILLKLGLKSNALNHSATLVEGAVLIEGAVLVEGAVIGKGTALVEVAAQLQLQQELQFAALFYSLRISTYLNLSSPLESNYRLPCDNKAVK